MNKRRRDKIEKRHADEAWSLDVREKGFCEVCEAKKGLNAHHILVKERYPEYRHEMLNGICLCNRCHKFAQHSAHRNPIWWSIWLKEHKPALYNWAEKHL